MEFSGQIPFFLSEYLSKPASALPKNALWVVDFEGINNVKPAILKTAEQEPNAWNIVPGLNRLIDDYLNNSNRKGCLFAQAVSVPGESFTANPEGIQQQNLIRTTVGGGRDAYNGLQITFLDTNVSFVDSVIRPWVLTTGRLGMKARSEEDKKYRTDIIVYKLGIFNWNTAPTILYKYTFHGACPISVSSEELNYVAASTSVNREATFSFHYYSVETPSSTFTNNIKPTDILKVNISNPDSQIPRTQ